MNQIDITSARIGNAVRALCPIIDERIKARSEQTWTDGELRTELVACVVGSQVRHEMAVAAMQNMEFAGLLDDEWWTVERADEFGPHVYSVLAAQRIGLPNKSKYRFPRTRADQLARVRDCLALRPISDRLKSDANIKQLRKQLVADIPGLGPKQASMFLRNIGWSYDLAILDTHVLRFLEMHRAVSGSSSVGTVKGYEMVESEIVSYAESLGYPAGYLDWAIWATMKAARELAI